MKNLVKNSLLTFLLTMILGSANAFAIPHQNVLTTEAQLIDANSDLDNLVGEYEVDSKLLACIICNHIDIEEIIKLNVIAATEDVIVIDLFDDNRKVDQIVAMATADGVYSEVLNENSEILVKVLKVNGAKKLQLVPQSIDTSEGSQTYSKTR